MNARTDNNLYVKETSKVSEITDKFGNLRFKVILDDKILPGGYQVLVLAFREDGEEKVVQENFSELEQAEKFFDSNVDKYVYLIKSEQYKKHDIRIYADRIGYRGIYPECCFMCKWSKPCNKNDRLFAADGSKRGYDFFCMHPTQFMQRDGRPDKEQVEVHPVVYALCVCDSFERPVISGASHQSTPQPRPTPQLSESCFSCQQDRIMQVIEQNAPVILDILDGIRDQEFNLDGGTAEE